VSKLPSPELPDLHDLGSFLKEQRQNAKLSLRQLSELAGVSNPYLSQIERGLKKPSAEILQQLARGLEVSAETLYVRCLSQSLRWQSRSHSALPKRAGRSPWATASSYSSAHSLAR